MLGPAWSQERLMLCMAEGRTLEECIEGPVLGEAQLWSVK